MSSKLSKRRATVRKPKICVAASCPPPPPPTVWPPETFLITGTGSTGPNGWPPNEIITIHSLVTRTTPTSWNWYALSLGYPLREIQWNLDPVSETANLSLMGTETPGSSGWSFSVANTAVAWGLPTYYEIYGWDYSYPYGASLTVKFTF